jgi:putative membrane protein
MWESAIVAYLHYASFMALFAALTLEAFMLRPDLGRDAGWKLVITDAVYGSAATLVLITGILRVLYFGKGTEFYLNNPVFYAKIAIFVVVGTLSLYPTITFLRWIPNLRQEGPLKLEQATVNRLTWIIRTELAGFALIPLLAAIMARGIGLEWS